MKVKTGEGEKIFSCLPGAGEADTDQPIKKAPHPKGCGAFFNRLNGGALCRWRKTPTGPFLLIFSPSPAYSVGRG